MSASGWALSLLLATAAVPCIWDSDTLDTELRGLPDAFDLVVGRWHRHGDAYYQQRITRLGGKAELTIAESDDLAVAYERLGDHDAAIAGMQRKAAALAKAPTSGPGKAPADEQRYRCLANLGTFQAHAGRYDEALTALRAAVALNPRAHFGREVFQIEAIVYVAAAKAKPELWARQSFLRHAGYPGSMWTRLIGMEWDAESQSAADHKVDWEGERELDPDRAYQAIGGMLRFGGKDAAELYRSLAEVFLEMKHLNLAWWSFRRAIECGHPASERLREAMRGIEHHWSAAAEHTDQANVVPDEALYRAVRENADRWLATFQELERTAIARGDDVSSDAGLQTLVNEVDRRVPRLAMPTAWSLRQKVLGAVAILFCMLGVLRWQQRRMRAHA